MVEKRYLHTLVGRKGEGRSRGGGASEAPSHPQLSVWDGVWGKEPWAGRQAASAPKLGCCVTLDKAHPLSRPWSPQVVQEGVDMRLKSWDLMVPVLGLRGEECRPGPGSEAGRGSSK